MILQLQILVKEKEFWCGHCLEGLGYFLRFIVQKGEWISCTPNALLACFQLTCQPVVRYVAHQSVWHQLPFDLARPAALSEQN